MIFPYGGKHLACENRITKMSSLAPFARQPYAKPHALAVCAERNA